jgi:hypothetical protein
MSKAIAIVIENSYLFRNKKNFELFERQNKAIE